MKQCFFCGFLLCLGLGIALQALPVQAEKLGLPSQRWGVLFSQRWADNPYLAAASPVEDVIPTLYFEQAGFYMHGLNLGYVLFQDEAAAADVRAVAKYRFFDYPLQLRGFRRDDGLDAGLEYHRELLPELDLYLDILGDVEGRPVGQARLEYLFAGQGFDVHLFAEALFKLSSYNRRHYGLDEKDPGADADL